jgi:hypothetical protein
MRSRNGVRWTLMAAVVAAALALVPAATAGHAGGVQLGHTHVTTELTGFLGHSNLPLLYAANDWGNGIAGISRGFGMGVYGAFERTAGTQPGVRGDTLSASASAVGVMGQVTANPAGGFSAGVRGINSGTTGNGIGVWGSQGGSGWGVYGTTPSGVGVYGQSFSGVGVQGSSLVGKAGLFLGHQHTTGNITRAYSSEDESRAVPIAYGAVNANGTLSMGTPNVSVTWEASLSRYRITIAGENYTFAQYATTITPSGSSPRTAMEDSAVGWLIVRIFDVSGTSVQAPFNFTTYKR